MFKNLFIKLNVLISMFILTYFLLFYGYSSKVECNDFINSFKKWYFSNHPQYVGNYNIVDNFVYITKNDIIYIKNYGIDLEHFQLELSQIDKNKISKRNLLELENIERLIKKLSLDYTIQKNFDLNINSYIIHINSILLNNIFAQDPDLLNSQNIKLLSKYIEKLVNTFELTINNNNVKAVSDINNIYNLLEEISLFVDINESLDYEIENLKNSLLLLKKTINNSFSYNNNQTYDIYKDYYYKDKEEYTNNINLIYQEHKKLKGEILDILLLEFVNDKHLINSNNHLLWDDFDKTDTSLIKELDLSNNIFTSDTLDAINYVLNKKYKKRIKDFDSNVINFVNRVDSINILNLFSSSITLDYEIISQDILNISMADNLATLYVNPYEENNIKILYNDKNSNSFIHNSKINNFIIEELLFNSILLENLNFEIHYLDEDKFYAWKKILSRIAISSKIDDYDDYYVLFYKINQLHDITNILAMHEIFDTGFIKDEKHLKEYLNINGYYDKEYLTDDILINTIYNPDYFILDDYLYLLELNKKFDHECLLNNKISYNDFIKKMINFY